VLAVCWQAAVAGISEQSACDRLGVNVEQTYYKLLAGASSNGLEMKSVAGTNTFLARKTAGTTRGSASVLSKPLDFKGDCQAMFRGVPPRVASGTPLCAAAAASPSRKPAFVSTVGKGLGACPTRKAAATAATRLSCTESGGGSSGGNSGGNSGGGKDAGSALALAKAAAAAAKKAYTDAGCNQNGTTSKCKMLTKRLKETLDEKDTLLAQAEGATIGTVATPREQTTTPPERFAESHGYPAGQVVEEETWAIAPTGDDPGILSCFSNQWLQLTALGYARSDYEPTSASASSSSNAALPPTVPSRASSSIASGRLKTPRSVGLTPRGDQAQPTTSTTRRSSRRSTSTASSQRTRFRDPPLQLENTTRTSSRGGLRIEMHSPRPKGVVVGPLRKVWSNVTSAKALFLVRAPPHGPSDHVYASTIVAWVLRAGTTDWMLSAIGLPRPQEPPDPYEH